MKTAHHLALQADQPTPTHTADLPKTASSDQKKANPLTYIRAISVFAVIFLHTSGEFLDRFDVKNPFSVNYLTGVGFYSFLRWATPFFILISGALMLNKKKWEEDKTAFLTKRIKRVLLPFSFWSVIYLAYQFRNYFENGKIPHYSTILNKIFLEDVYYHLWFIPMIIGMYFLTPFLRVFLKSATKSDIEYFLLLCFVFTGLQNFYPTLFVVKYIGWFGYVGFYVLGHYLTTYPLSNSFKKWLYTAGILAIPFQFIATLIVSNWEHAYVNRYFIYFSPNVAILTAALFSFLLNTNWQNFANKFPRLNQFLLLTNDLSFGIYFIHVLIIDLLKNGYLFNFQISPTTFLYQPVAPYFGVLITAFFTSLLSILIIAGLNKINFLKKLLM